MSVGTSPRLLFGSAVFAAAIAVRLVLLYSVYDDLRHGSASYYGSSAIGLFSGRGLSYTLSEMEHIGATRTNLTGDFLSFQSQEKRDPSTEFLPGPAILLAGLWRIVGLHNFTPYLVTQAILDSLLIGLFAMLFVRIQPIVATITTVLLAVNLPGIRRTLMMGYDFWPEFALMVAFLALIYSMTTSKERRALTVLAISGVLIGWAAWCRDITVFFAFFALAGALLVWRWIQRRSVAAVVFRSALFIVPVILLTLFLSLYRYETTGNWRPTRSTFWHSFFTGVAQFSNPYGLTNNDQVIFEFGQRLNPALEGNTLSEMYQSPNSPYERTLKQEAMKLVTHRPFLFFRNIAFRLAIMISPGLYSGGDFIPYSMTRVLFPIGILMMPFWILGLVRVRARNAEVFWLMISFYLYFFVTFSWFYVVGRVILPFLFLSIITYLNGFMFAFELASKALRKNVSRSGQ